MEKLRKILTKVIKEANPIHLSTSEKEIKDAINRIKN